MPSTPDFEILIFHQNLEIRRKGTWNPSKNIPLLFLIPVPKNTKKLPYTSEKGILLTCSLKIEYPATGIRPLMRGPPRGRPERLGRMRQDHLCRINLHQRRPNKVLSGSHPSPKQPVVGCFALCLGLPSPTLINNLVMILLPILKPLCGGSSERSSEG